MRKRAFSIWQHTPYKLAPLTDEKHICQSCGTEFQGNFCPRCGQSARIGRFSFKTAALLFLDIWGVGNRGMFRSIRDLLLRPGYMIRDYVNGRQSAYFPPFKMFFILATFSLLITHGFNLNVDEPVNTIEEKAEKAEVEEMEDVKEMVNHPENLTINGEVMENDIVRNFRKLGSTLSAFEEKSPTLFAFLTLVLISAPLYLFFRRCPAVPDLRYSEHLVALVYTANMYSVYMILASVVPFVLSGFVKLLALVMFFVALKQFTGYTKRRLFLYFFLTFLICLAVVISVALFLLSVIYLSCQNS